MRRTWSNVGPGNASDSELMAWAATNLYLVLTADLDFGAILAASKGSAPSVVLLRSDILAPNAIGTSVILALRQAEQELSDGALMSIDAAHARLRILPIT